MDYISTKERLEEHLGGAKKTLEALGVSVDMAVEVITNEIEGEESDVLKVFGSIGIATADITDDEVFYLSVDLDVFDNEVEDDAIDAAISEFDEMLAKVVAKLEASENKTEAIKELDREVDEELAEKYRLEAERQQRAAKRDLTVAIIATVAIVIVAIAAIVISKII